MIKQSRRTTHWITTLLLGAIFSSSAVAISGCRVTEDDVHRWETTAHGPDKLREVLLHDKYDIPLRVEAALSLIQMKPRQGRREGIKTAVEALASIRPEARQAIVSALVPVLNVELKKPLPPSGQADNSYPIKDAVFLMLTYEGTVIVADEALRQSMKNALIEWAMMDFERRYDKANGMEKMLGFLGAPSVVGIPKLMTKDSRHLEQMAGLVAKLGDDKTKVLASQALVDVAKYVTSAEWTKAKKPDLEAANAASKLKPTEKQFEAQLAAFQDEELFRIFASMRKLGGRPILDYCLGFAASKEQNEKRRQAALAAVEGLLDRNNAADVNKLLQIAMSDAPDVVLDQAFRRIGEMPRESVVSKLYEMFKTDKWKVRRAAASTVLKMSTVKHIDEFLSKLSDVKNFAMPEALAYGAMFGDLKEGTPIQVLTPHMDRGSPEERTSALAYYFSFGTSADLAKVQPHESDKTAAPSCDADPDCKWVCEIPKEGAKDPNEREQKEIKSVGEFVQYCIVPAMKSRQPEPKKDGKK